MNRFFSLLLVSLLSGAITLVGYKYFIEDSILNTPQEKTLDPGNFQTIDARVGDIQTASDFTTIAQSTVDAVVHVKNVSYLQNRSNALLEFFYGQNYSKPQAQIGMGSGVIISPDGYIVTNNHVIAKASELEVTLNDNQVYSATVIGTDPQSDIALLKINATQNLPYLIFGDSDKIELAQWVLAVGNPFNLTSTVTAGIISAKARNLSKTGIQSFIQTDAVINPGNSGGALVNNKGELIGINTMISSNTGSYVGYGFAVPSNLTKKIIQDLMQFGNVKKAAIGVNGGELNQHLAKELNLSISQGFYISSIYPESNAHKAGLKPGDIITKINGKKIATFIDLKTILNQKNPGDLVELTITSGDTQKQVSLELIGELNQRVNFHGFEFATLTDQQKQQLNIPNGLIITQVQNSKYLAYKQDLLGGILISINDKQIDSIEKATKLFNQITDLEKIKLKIMTPNGQYISLLL
ncbi:trypsin-like peptidase domain-containing protein [Myroides sp. LJL119]